MATMKIIQAAFVLMSTIPLSAASPPDVTFLCNKIPEACTNMCWAVRCANPTFPQTLNWDNPDATTQRQRRISAGCNPSGNKCGTNKSGVGHRGPPNISCDEYPFASTSESTYPNGHQVSRCIPGTENSSQGKSLMTAYQRFKNEGYTSHSLKINFGNPGSSGVNYCLNQACNNDGFEVQNQQLSKRDIETPTFRFYMTRSGMTLGSLSENDVPSNFTREVDDNENLSLDFETWWETIEGEDIRLMTDTIVAEI